MSWLKDLVRPKILTSAKRDVTPGVWEKCPGCGDMIYQKDLAVNLAICTSCGHHLPISLDERFGYLLDEASAEPIPVKAPPADPLKFRDRKRYSDRLRDAAKKAGGGKNRDAFRVVRAHIDGRACVVCALDFAFMAGSMGTFMGQAIVTAANTARKDNVPLIMVTASGGARMQEGILSLMQMARTTAAIKALKEAGLPYIVLLTDPTTGGVTASFAMIGDIHMAEPGALIGFAGPRVIEQTIGETLPEGFQRAEYLKAHGMIDMVTPRPEQKAMLARLMDLLGKTPRA